jgi:2-haloalkanoic acid dehalogenase type II
MAPLPSPRLLTFDVFGTVVDWQRGMREAVAPLGVALSTPDFDRVVDRQGQIERERPTTPYRAVTAESLVECLGLHASSAQRVGGEVGRWPLFPDSAAALRELQAVAPCGAMTNSDPDHGEQVQAQLGFRLTHWLCAGELRVYKPSPEVWREASRRTGLPLDERWWHVSAYADYDLEVARSLGLTTVLVRRPHCRPAKADAEVADLRELLELVKRTRR